MDLLLVHAYFLAEDPLEQQVMKPYPPLGLLYLSSHLKRRDVDVAIFDGTFQTFDAFVDLLARERPAIVGIYCNLMTKRAALRVIAESKRHGASVVVGGPEPSQYADLYLAHGADVVVVGEGELTLEELCAARRTDGAAWNLRTIAGIVFRDEDGRVVRTAPRTLIADLDAQPIPDRDAIDVAQYLATWRTHHGTGSISLVTARGCPYTCTWCSRSVFGQTHRRRTPANVADEVALIVDRYHPDQLWYTDDVFTIHPGWTLKYADEMARRHLRVRFECISRAERITDEVADALVELGCFRLWIGSESGSQRILDAMERRVAVEQVQEATHRLQRRGIQVGMFIMLGYLGEELTDLRATIEHLKRARPDVFLTTVAYPIKGTKYYEQVAAQLISPGSWEGRTDRDLGVRGRHTKRYYQFARRWMVHEVDRDRHWRRGRYLHALASASKAGAARMGMAMTARERES